MLLYAFDVSALLSEYWLLVVCVAVFALSLLSIMLFGTLYVAWILIKSCGAEGVIAISAYLVFLCVVSLFSLGTAIVLFAMCMVGCLMWMATDEFYDW